MSFVGDSQLVNVVDGGGQNVSQLKIDIDVILLYVCCYAHLVWGSAYVNL